MIVKYLMTAMIIVMALVAFGGGNLVPSVAKVSVRGATFKAAIAQTPTQIQQGLMYRTSLADDEGMYFVFDTPDYRSFWMKNTLIPLDIIFIDEHYRIVTIHHHVPPCPPEDSVQGNCRSYSSKKPAQYVLEIKGGMAKKFGLRVGDKVRVAHRGR